MNEQEINSFIGYIIKSYNLNHYPSLEHDDLFNEGWLVILEQIKKCEEKNKPISKRIIELKVRQTINRQLKKLNKENEYIKDQQNRSK